MLENLTKLALNARRVVVLTGAGISAESGVPTFRGKEGLWGKFKPEELATMEAFLANPNIVREWYSWRRELLSGVKPNDGHIALAQLESCFESFTLITQNVDGLHQIAQSRKVLELHGNINENKCVSCGKLVGEKVDINPDELTNCSDCSGQIRPNVVWFGEMLPENVVEEAFRQSERADLFFTIGTSALVHPAASLPVLAKRSGAALVEINPEITPLTELADIAIQAESGKVLPELVKRLKSEQLA